MDGVLCNIIERQLAPFMVERWEKVPGRREKVRRYVQDGFITVARLEPIRNREWED